MRRGSGRANRAANGCSARARRARAQALGLPERLLPGLWAVSEYFGGRYMTRGHLRLHAAPGVRAFCRDAALEAVKQLVLLHYDLAGSAAEICACANCFLPRMVRALAQGSRSRCEGYAGCWAVATCSVGTVLTSCDYMCMLSDQRAARQGASAGRVRDLEAQAELDQRNAKDLVDSLLGLPIAPEPDQAPSPVLHIEFDAQARSLCSAVRPPWCTACCRTVHAARRADARPPCRAH